MSERQEKSLLKASDGLIRKEPLQEELPALNTNQALTEANRCLFCFDAPCTHACPTHIDIPRFIKRIATGNVTGAARTILDSNLLGATCARVCPVQELCEGACVLGPEHKPIAIGRLQRYATDYIYDRGIRVFEPRTVTGHKIAVIGSGPAGLSCAGELAKLGHVVTIYERRELAGGLSTYGIISLREPIAVAQAEVEFIRQLGVEIQTGVELCNGLKLTDLRDNFAAVFIGAGLGHTPSLGIPGEEHALDGLRYIEESKRRPAGMKIGRSVAIVGAGNTAIDCATVAKRLGAERVTVVYRRTEAEMTAYRHEYEFILREGVEFRFLSQPSRVLIADGQVAGLECVEITLGAPDGSGRRSPKALKGSEFVLAADQIVKAIGQEKPTLAQLMGLATENGRIRVNEFYETSLAGVYAGGDCVRVQGACSTVMAVEDGKLAAQAIHKKLIESASRVSAV